MQNLPLARFSSVSGRKPLSFYSVSLKTAVSRHSAAVTNPRIFPFDVSTARRVIIVYIRN